MEHRFNQAIALLNQAGFKDISERLTIELNAFNADTYKIAVVGEFKAGKSTLINRIFLKDDVLFTDLLEATAVPTQIRYGTEKLLKIVPYDRCQVPVPELAVQNENTFDVAIGEGEAIEIIDPAYEDIKKHTSAQSPEERTALASKTARVILTWPAINLAGLTVYDTPGINTLNEAVISTTYRIIPEVDVVLFVTNARQLSNMEMSFLSGRVFGEGITRAMIVISYDPDVSYLSPDLRRKLVRAIRGQLASIGRDNVPVEIINIRDKSTLSIRQTGFRERIDECDDAAGTKAPHELVDNVIGSLLGENNRLSGMQIADDEISASGFEGKLIQFIRQNVRPARIEKASRTFKTQLQLFLVRCSSELSALTKTKDERMKLLNEIKAKEMQIRLSHEKLWEQLENDLNAMRQTLIHELFGELEKFSGSFISGFEACSSLGELQERLNKSESILKPALEDTFAVLSKKTEIRLKELIEKYGVKNQVLLNPWQSEVSRDMAIDGGILANVPPFAVFAVDLLLFVRFGPFGPLVPILARLAANYIPYINKVMPFALAGQLLKRNIKNSIKEQFEAIKAELPDKINASFKQIVHHLKTEWNAYADEQLSAVSSSLEKSLDKSRDEETCAMRRQELEYLKDNANKLIAEF